MNMSMALPMLIAVALATSSAPVFSVAATTAPAASGGKAEQHKCIHDSVALQRSFSSGMDLHIPQPGEPLGASSRDTATGQVQPKGKRSFKAEATTFTGSLRITISSLDLEDSTKYCTQVGATSPTFQSATSTATCTAEDVLTTAKKSILLNNILPLAVAKLQNVLNVAQLTSNLVIPSTHCTAISKNTTRDQSTGIPSTDFVLYVTGGPTTIGTLAFATYCALSAANRPIAGVANFGPRYLVWSTTDTVANDATVATAVHEILHALGFSNGYITKYFPVSSATSSGGAVISTALSTLRGKTTASLVSTDKVIVAARNFFNCGTLSAPRAHEGADGRDPHPHPTYPHLQMVGSTPLLTTF